MIKPERIAIFTKENELYDGLALALSPLAPVVRSPDSLDSKTLVLVDERKGPAINELKPTLHMPWLFWIGQRDDKEHIQFIHEHHLHHLIGLDAVRTPWEAELQIKKIFAGKDKWWGLKPYLSAGTSTDGFSLSESNKRGTDQVQEILKLQEWSEFFDSPQEHLALIANELVSNALYNGPEDKRSGSAHYPIDRKDPVFLRGSELVQVNLGMDNHAVSLSVMDCFGTLDWTKTVGSLHRGFQEKTVQYKKGGAGLGLYLAFSHGNQFIVNRRAGLRTEVICLIEKNRRYRQYKGRLKSFHFFEEASS